MHGFYKGGIILYTFISPFLNTQCYCNHFTSSLKQFQWLHNIKSKEHIIIYFIIFLQDI